MIQTTEIHESNYSLLGKHCKIQGDLTLRGTTHIFSEIKGSIKHSDDSTLILEHCSNVEGSITGTDVILIGTFNGTIHASGKVIIQPTAKVTGEINCQNLVVQPGAFLEITGTASCENMSSLS